MKSFAVVAMFALLLAAPPAFAQTADQAGQPGNMPESGFGPKAMLAAGKIAEIDLGRGTLTLDNGMQFTLPPIPPVHELPGAWPRRRGDV